jgi:hypothetical protein
MSRKAIPDETQKRVLMKSRRRCCLCFWLEGTDEVQRGQICHLDNDNENADEDNLVFLCFDHHDTFDGITRISKGLKPNEVREWRNLLYGEMEYRFRSAKTKSAALAHVGFKWTGNGTISAFLQLKNTGNDGLSDITIAIRLPDDVAAGIPMGGDDTSFDGKNLRVYNQRFVPWTAYESCQDLFEPKGRTCLHGMPDTTKFLMPGHSIIIHALTFTLQAAGSEYELDYRIDA